MTTPLSSSRAPPPRPLPPAIAEAVAYIHTHLDERLALADLAVKAKLSLWRFCTVFRLHTGTSPHRYICALRIDRVQALMTQGVSASVAASSVGFYDQSHLTRHFKNALGLTPGQFMNQIRSDEPVAA